MLTTQLRRNPYCTAATSPHINHRESVNIYMQVDGPQRAQQAQQLAHRWQAIHGQMLSIQALTCVSRLAAVQLGQQQQHVRNIPSTRQASQTETWVTTAGFAAAWLILGQHSIAAVGRRSPVTPQPSCSFTPALGVVTQPQQTCNAQQCEYKRLSLEHWQTPHY